MTTTTRTPTRAARRILVPGTTCGPIVEAPRSGLLVDASDYFAAFYAAARRAERYVLLAGWQFDSEVALLRRGGTDAPSLEAHEEEARPVRLLSFLNDLCERNPELRIFMLAWDFSVAYALEREWLQRIIFDWSTSERLAFVFDGSHPVDGCHHQKFVVVDGRVAFLGGIDLCDHRWDDRRHLPKHPDRLEVDGMPYDPFHDVQAYVEGAAVRQLEELFVARWRRTGGPIELPACAGARPLEVPPQLLRFPASGVALSRTLPRTEAERGVDGAPVARDRAVRDELPRGATREIEALVVSAITNAETLIYIENQYVSSHAVARAFVQRMRDEARSKLDIVLVLPRQPENVKEQFAVGITQARVLSTLQAVADATGHRLAVVNTVAVDESGAEFATYVHSKLMIVDDRFLTVGSANLTNRSMGVDSETNISWEASPSDDAQLRASIRRVRVSLLVEHTGLSTLRALRRLARAEGLAAHLHELAASKTSRLRLHEATPVEDSAFYRALDDSMLRFLDPPEPMLERELDAAGGLPELLAGAARRFIARLTSSVGA